MNYLSADYWDHQYKYNQTGWDIGYVSTPLKEYFDQLKDKTIKILIPGSGNSYEAEYLWKNGFINVNVLDISELAMNSFQNRLPDFPESNLLNENFFSHTSEYDLIVEQTFFSALHPEQRKDYAAQTSELLKPNGKLIGLLFGSAFRFDGPPFGGNKEEYIRLFSPFFQILTMEMAYNSIKPRDGNELFFIMKKLNS